jgi:protocatechuate 4,5-dioxygenase alpha chain
VSVSRRVAYACLVSAPEYDDIPGTFVFDGRRSRQGYWLNQFCMSLRDDANRQAFRADEQAYLDRFPLTAEQRQAVLDRDWLRMLELGGNIYYTFKLAACDGLTFQQLAAKQTGVTEEEYVAMMVGGGRSIEGNRSAADG